jgi:hypothetical protein
MCGKELVASLNDYFFDDEYYEDGLPSFEYWTNGEEEAIFFAGVLIIEWIDVTIDDIFEQARDSFNSMISKVFQASADAQCSEMEK